MRSCNYTFNTGVVVLYVCMYVVYHRCSASPLYTCIDTSRVFVELRRNMYICVYILYPARKQPESNVYVCNVCTISPVVDFAHAEAIDSTHHHTTTTLLSQSSSCVRTYIHTYIHRDTSQIIYNHAHACARIYRNDESTLLYCYTQRYYLRIHTDNTRTHSFVRVLLDNFTCSRFRHTCAHIESYLSFSLSIAYVTSQMTDNDVDISARCIGTLHCSTCGERDPL